MFIEETLFSMRNMKKYIIPILIMSVVSILMLLAVSVLAYIYKWQADKALIGITGTYILAGLAGGLGLRRVSSIKDMSRKLLESILLGIIFMVLLIIFSLIMTDNAFQISGRFLLIWMLITGSASLGRIL